MMPTSQQHAILQLLIRNYPSKTNVFTIVQETHALNHTARMSNLRSKGVAIKCTYSMGVDKYGNSCKHTFYVLEDINEATNILKKVYETS